MTHSIIIRMKAGQSPDDLRDTVNRSITDAWIERSLQPGQTTVVVLNTAGVAVLSLMVCTNPVLLQIQHDCIRRDVPAPAAVPQRQSA